MILSNKLRKNVRYYFFEATGKKFAGDSNVNVQERIIIRSDFVHEAK